MANEVDSKYIYDRFGSKGMRVGQAVHDILSHEQPDVLVEDILQEYAPQYAAEIEKCVQDNFQKYGYPFHVLALTKKEMWAVNMVRNFFIARKTAPEKGYMMAQYPHFAKTLYRVTENNIEVVWCLPDFEACKSIMNRPEANDPQLLGWINECMNQMVKIAG